MDSLFTGAASERRKWLDRMVLAIDKSHGTRVNAFEKAMRQRNKLLDEAPNETVWLDGLEGQMAEFGSAIATARAEMISLLNRSLSILHGSDGGSAFPNAILGLEGLLERDAFSRPAVESEEHYRTVLTQDADARPRRRGERWKVRIVRICWFAMLPRICRRQNAPRASRRRSCLVLCWVTPIWWQNGAERHPLVLLDEVAAHLDESRRLALFDLLDRLDCQAWVTGTDDGVFAPLGERAERFHVEQGTIRPVDEAGAVA